MDNVHEVEERNAQLSNEDEIYIKQIESWFKEQKEREKQIQVTMETSFKIAEQNELQLGWSRERTSVALGEYNDWRKEKGLPTTERGCLY